jgi:hypothetical protein
MSQDVFSHNYLAEFWPKQREIVKSICFYVQVTGTTHRLPESVYITGSFTAGEVTDIIRQSGGNSEQIFCAQ